MTDPIQWLTLARGRRQRCIDGLRLNHYPVVSVQMHTQQEIAFAGGSSFAP